MATNTKESEIAGPAPGRPVRPRASRPCSMRSSTGAFRMLLKSNLSPAAAVPVSVKIPEPMTEPMPNATRLPRPRVRRRRAEGAALAAIRASMDFVRKSPWVRSRDMSPKWQVGDLPHLPLALALNYLLYLALLRATGHVGGPWTDRRGGLARSALGLLAFYSVFYVLGVHSILIPAYFATSFFNPYPGKLTVTLASSPEPSNRTMVPRPYLTCSMVDPNPVFLRGITNGFGSAGFAAAAGTTF